MAEKDLFIRNCEIPFILRSRFSVGDYKGCAIELEGGRRLDVQIPSNVRFGEAPFIRFLASDDGQKVIKYYMKR